jgi:hypothetical protein
VRGVGPSAWFADEKKQTQIRRRYWLLGQTLEGMRVYDVRRAIKAMKEIDSTKEIRLTGFAEMGVVGLYAAIFEPVGEIEVRGAVASHFGGPQLLNVMKVMDVPVAVALAGEKSKVRVIAGDVAEWGYAKEVAERMGWKSIEIVPVEK